MKSFTSAVLLAVCLISPVSAQQPPDPWPGQKKVLAIGDSSTSYQHDSVSHALSVIERLGRESGIYVTVIKTDTQLVTKGEVQAAVGRTLNARNLDFFDAIFFFGAGPGTMTQAQMDDLLSFVRDDGKGFVAAHTGDNAFQQFPQYREMIGGLWDHPWTRSENLVIDMPVIVEDPDFPIMQSLPPVFTVLDEPSVHQAPYSRENVRVLARMDLQKVDPALGRSPEQDNDVPVAWVKNYGKGRVFYSTFGHSDESWDNPVIQRLFLDALRWSMGLLDE